jgi:sugar phosphate isomerase/epimerase
MPRHKLAVVLESLNLSLRAALDVAPRLGAQGVQWDAVGALGPDALSQTGRRELRQLLRARNLEAAALGCPLRHGFDVADRLDARIAHVRNVLTLAYELGPRVVVAAAGAVPARPEDPAWPILVDSLTELGRHGERVGVTLALAAGAEPPAVLADFLRRLQGGGLGASLDPASLLQRGHDPVEAVRTLGELIVHVHARDAVPERLDRSAQEVSLGHGDVDWPAFLGALEEVGYRGWLTLRRGPCPDPVADLKAAAAFLRRLVG